MTKNRFKSHQKGEHLWILPISESENNALAVHDIKIIEGADKLFVAMPSRKTPEGEYKDITHPINKEMRENLEHMILEK